MDLISLARRVVEERCPQASAAVLAGGSGTGRTTAASDLDIVVLMEVPPAPFRETVDHDGRPVELFCHTGESYEVFAVLETAAGRSPLLHMCAEGVLLFDRDGSGERMCDDARKRLAAGPKPLSPTQVEDQRYALTDLLDDLPDAPDADELLFTANRLLTLTAEHVLAVRGLWRSNGKWLLRRLRAADPGLSAALLSSYRQLVATGDPDAFTGAVRQALDTTGGRVFVGYRREGMPVHQRSAVTPSPR